MWATGLVLLAVALPSCNQGCTEEARAGLSVRVIDKATQEPICDAEVRATDGAYSELLSHFPSTDCRYAGAWERSGKYHVTVTRAGYVSGAQDVTVTEDECHVDGQAVTIELSPDTP